MMNTFAVGLVVLLAGCRPMDTSLDLDPPRLLGSSLPGDDALGTTTPIRIQFSEAMDPSTVTADSVMVVPYRSIGSCTTDLSCPVGTTCHADECQQDVVDAAWIADVVHPPLTAGRRQRRAPLRLSVSAEEVLLEPIEPLSSHRLHRLLVGPTLTDPQGNAVWVEPPLRLALLRGFATGSADSGRPTLWLRSPSPGSADLPRNLARVVVRSSRRVTGVGDPTLGLELASGGPVATRLQMEPSPLCRGAAPDTCFEIRVLQLLPPRSMLRLVVRDGVTGPDGQSALQLPGQVLATGDTLDTTPPATDGLRAQLSDGCVVARLLTAEPADLWIDGSWGALAVSSVGATRHEVAMRHGPPGNARVTIQDLAGNAASVVLPVAPLAVPRVAITEVLANPMGPEPAQELVELTNLSAQPVQLGSFQLDDGDDGVGAGLLPAAVLLPGQRAVVVGKGFKASSDTDPAVIDAALLLRLPGVLGASGLSNAGESVVLRDPAGRLVSSYSNQLGAAKTAGHSVQRRVAAACDVQDNWTLAPATPGW